VLQVISLPDHPEDVQQESKADKLLLSMDTRTLNRGSSSSSSSRAGGKRGVVVDVRDFRSTLPSALYVSGEVSCLAEHIVFSVFV
jgi:ERCC4-type nuclease